MMYVRIRVSPDGVCVERIRAAIVNGTRARAREDKDSALCETLA